MWYEIAPLCRLHHREQEGRTKAFEAKYGLDLEDIASRVAMEWKKGAK